MQRSGKTSFILSLPAMQRLLLVNTLSGTKDYAVFNYPVHITSPLKFYFRLDVKRTSSTRTSNPFLRFVQVYSSPRLHPNLGINQIVTCVSCRWGGIKMMTKDHWIDTSMGIENRTRTVLWVKTAHLTFGVKYIPTLC